MALRCCMHTACLPPNAAPAATPRLRPVTVPVLARTTIWHCMCGCQCLPSAQRDWIARRAYSPPAPPPPPSPPPTNLPGPAAMADGTCATS